MKFARFLSGLPVVAAAIFLLAAAPEARAAVFACSTQINGDATTQGFTGCIDVLSFGEGLQLPLGTGTGTGAERTTENPLAKPFRLVKPLDRSSPLWRDKLLTGTEVNEVTISFTMINTQTGNLVPYFEITLGNALVTEISMTAGQDGVPTEVISLQALQVDWKYTPYDKDGAAGQGIPTSWNFGAASKI